MNSFSTLLMLPEFIDELRYGILVKIYSKWQSCQNKFCTNWV